MTIKSDVESTRGLSENLSHGDVNVEQPNNLLSDLVQVAISGYPHSMPKPCVFGILRLGTTVYKRTRNPLLLTLWYTAGILVQIHTRESHPHAPRPGRSVTYQKNICVTYRARDRLQPMVGCCLRVITERWKMQVESLWCKIVSPRNPRGWWRRQQIAELI